MGGGRVNAQGFAEVVNVLPFRLGLPICTTKIVPQFTPKKLGMLSVLYDAHRRWPRPKSRSCADRQTSLE